MTAHIRVYLFKETFAYFRKNNQIIKELIDDHNVKIEAVDKTKNIYYSIAGKYEQIHKVRIVLQDIEREYYKELQ